ncbi:hypothetical protein GCM10022381_36490 [Leifsonia kafniensis]|uniref:FMN-binding domain-containing protein n=1 Tax=Leifsonia kafniensis TaxID=475957 RepID=A0ABP7KZU5_9MICO
MRLKKWRGTMLFAVILTTMGLTIGLKLYGTADLVGASASGTTTSAGVALPSTPQPTVASAPVPSGAAVTPTPAPSATAATPSAAASAGVTTTIDGQVEQTRYGPIQVAVTFVDSTITAVTELQAPSNEGRSVEINQQAAPLLEQEVLASQSANIDTVSGATYTSDGYARSVQSAIDQR